MPKRAELRDILLSFYARKDYNAQRFITAKKDGPDWGEDTRRVAVYLDTDKTIPDQEVKDAPLGHGWRALPPPGVKGARAKQCWMGRRRRARKCEPDSRLKAETTSHHRR